MLARIKKKGLEIYLVYRQVTKETFLLISLYLTTPNIVFRFSGISGEAFDEWRSALLKQSEGNFIFSFELTHGLQTA